MSEVLLCQVSAVKCFLDAPESVGDFLYEKLTFKPETFGRKSVFWDGYVRLFNTDNKTFDIGLIPYVHHLLKTEGIPSRIIGDLKPRNVSEQDIVGFVSKIKMQIGGKDFDPRYYQTDAIQKAISDRRVTIISPTASGKTAIMYVITRILQQVIKSRKILIIVPSIDLIQQAEGDFRSYTGDSWSFDRNVHVLRGPHKATDKPITIATWQSLQNEPKAFFDPFTAVIADEAHGAKAKSMVYILESLVNADDRIGLTGTMGDEVHNRLQIIGLLGPTFQKVTTRELIDQGYLSQFRVKQLHLSHTSLPEAMFVGQEFPFVQNALLKDDKRNRFLVSLIKSLNKNTLVLSTRLEHLMDLRDRLEGSGKEVYYQDKDTPDDLRMHIRKRANEGTNIVVLATYRTFATGISINNLHGAILAGPMKAKITTLQAIGRLLRLADDGKPATLFDLVDDVRFFRKQGEKRRVIYESERFDMDSLSYRL